MGFAIGEEGVPVSGHLVISRKQKILGEGVVDQIVNPQGQARLVVAPRHLKEGAVVVHLGSTARPAGDGWDSRIVPCEDIAPVEGLFEADEAVAEDEAILVLSAIGEIETVNGSWFFGIDCWSGCFLCWRRGDRFCCRCRCRCCSCCR